ncbi:MAG: methionyl-tRNA formyltransferase [Lachnospiraceae bacterium]|nr:methionyl-tRNA formyltransferase [Lachnospiraceae bacterium]
MKIVYMGTPDFAVAPLEAIIKAGHQVMAVVTQPDKQKGRGKEVQMTPVKTCAVQHGIPVFQPVKIREPEAVNKLKEYEADIFVIAAFGQILSEEILTMPPLGCVNIHASLLPAYRGAAPIQWAVINGEKESGVTIMRMEKGIDTGAMYAKKAVPLTHKETGASLHDKLMQAGAELIVEALPKIASGELAPIEQDDSKATHVGRLDKSMGKIDWGKDADVIERLIRGLNSWPSAYTTCKGKTLKIWEADVVAQQGSSVPGTIETVGKDSVDVACGSGILRVYSLQLEGKKRMAVKDFLLGYTLEPGMVLGN